MSKQSKSLLRIVQGNVQRCACGKVGYDKKGAVSAKNLRWSREHVELRIYPCPQSDKWHLTKRI